jgi:hypothetical protein
MNKCLIRKIQKEVKVSYIEITSNHKAQEKRKAAFKPLCKFIRFPSFSFSCN